MLRSDRRENNPAESPAVAEKRVLDFPGRPGRFETQPDRSGSLGCAFCKKNYHREQYTLCVAWTLFSSHMVDPTFWGQVFNNPYPWNLKFCMKESAIKQRLPGQRTLSRARLVAQTDCNILVPKDWRPRSFIPSSSLAQLCPFLFRAYVIVSSETGQSVAS